MRITIKTSHGYLSLQPDGRLEFRDSAGAWETFDLQSLDAIPVPPPTGETTPPPSGEITPAPNAAYVQAVKDDLIRQGKDLSGPCGAFEITKTVAWGLRYMGYGLLDKPSGNMCSNYAVDIVMQPDGRGWDVLLDGGGANTPAWNLTEIEDGINRYRPAIDPATPTTAASFSAEMKHKAKH
jgi:hypothetical protein